MRKIKTLLFTLPEPIRFLLAGIMNTFVGYLLFAVGLLFLTAPLQSLGSSDSRLLSLIVDNYYLVIQWAMWVISVPFGAFTLKYYAFQSKGSYLRQALRSYMVYFPLQLLASVFLAVFARVLTASFGTAIATVSVGTHELDPLILIAQLCTLVFTTILSYLGHKHFTFRKTGQDDENPS
jgi:putative flippase GtrA